MNLKIFFAAAVLLSAPETGTSEVMRFACDYDFVCSKKGDCGNTDLSLEFVVDIITKQAMLIGNNGIAEVGMHEGTDGVTFLETLNTGAVQTTTIAGDGFSSHSRHTIITSSLYNSQYIGTCKFSSE